MDGGPDGRHIAWIEEHLAWPGQAALFHPSGWWTIPHRRASRIPTCQSRCLCRRGRGSGGRQAHGDRAEHDAGAHDLLPQPLTRRICHRCVTAEVGTDGQPCRRLAWGSDTPAPSVVGGVCQRAGQPPGPRHTELRHRASAQLRGERKNHTLQPTALVNETYLRLLAQRRVDWQNRAHFFSLASRMMRRVLVGPRPHARRSETSRRGVAGDARRRPLERRPTRVQSPVAGPGADRAQRPRCASEQPR